MNSKKVKQLRAEYSDFCTRYNKPQDKASWRRFKKLYTEYKEQFLK
jgi:hypothetical protein